MATRRLRSNLSTLAPVNQKLAGPSGMKRQCSPNKQQAKRVKRAAFGDITNKENNKGQNASKKTALKKVTKSGRPATSKAVVVVPKASKATSEGQQADSSWEVIELSQETQSSQSSQSSVNSSLSDDLSLLNSQESKEEKVVEIDDVDKEHLKDPFQVALYAKDIFNYYKERELQFPIPPYMKTIQKDLTPHMRSILIDWQVEVQENFELNHETLYLAVKLVDHYLVKTPVRREQLQLVGAAALFIACKFDERCPPVLDDFLYICDDAYTRTDLILMEMKILRTINFDLGIPLSYRFLRRYAKCARATIETLTLARYVLEMSLMDYNIVRERDSLTAAAALLLAMKMNATKEWSPTMEYYTGYQETELLPLMHRLNAMISAPPNSQLNTIRTKYSHRVFHEVAKISTLPIHDLSAVESVDLSSASSSPKSEKSSS